MLMKDTVVVYDVVETQDDAGMPIVELRKVGEYFGLLIPAGQAQIEEGGRVKTVRKCTLMLNADLLRPDQVVEVNGEKYKIENIRANINNRLIVAELTWQES